MAKQQDLVVKMTINSQDFDAGLKNAKKEMSSFDSSIGNLAKSFGKISIAIKGAETAMNFFKKALTGTEQGADDFRQIMYTADSTTKKFYQTLNGGGSSFNFFIDNLENIRKNAEEAYEALDKLGTMKMWTSARIAQYGAQIAEDRAIVNNKNSSDKDVREAQERINKNLGLMEALSGDLVEQTRISAKAKLRDMSGAGKEISDATLEQWVKWFEEGTLSGSAAAYRRMHADYYESEVAQSSPTTGVTAYTYKTGDWVFRNKENEAVFDAMNRLATITEEEWTQYYNLLKEEAVLRESLANQVNKAQKTSQKEFKSGGGSGGSSNAKTGPTMTEEQVMDYMVKAFQNETLNADREKDAIVIDFEIPEEDIIEEDTEALVKAVADAQERMRQLAIETQAAFTAASSLAGAFTAFGEVSDGTLGKVSKSLGGVIQQIISTMQALMTLTGAETVEGIADVFANTPGGVWTKLAAAGIALSGIMGIIASAKSSFAGSFAEGGTVGGTSFTGDKLWARVNSGERILTKAQWDDFRSGGGGNVRFVIEGSQLKGVLDNYDKTQNL